MLRCQRFGLGRRLSGFHQNVPAYLHLISCVICGGVVWAEAKQSGSVRAADQFVPGATVTAVQGDTKVTTFTDESGRYVLDLTPGVWDIQVQVFGFTPVHEQVTVAAEPSFKDWTVEMPHLAGAPAPPAAAPARNRQAGFNRGGPPRDGAPGNGPPGNRRAQPGQPAAPQRQGFQNAAVTATQDGQQALAEAASTGATALGDPGEADEPFLVNGSTSGGLAQSSDDESRRQRMAGSRRWSPGWRSRRRRP